jgi:hypothetical protein
LDSELCPGKTLYARNGDKAFITSVSKDVMTVECGTRQYIRRPDDVGKTLFFTNPLEEAATEVFEGDLTFEQETVHLRKTQTELESFSGFLLKINVGDNGYVIGTETGFDEVTKEELIANPYFARMDIEIADERNNQLEIAYIGKKGVYHQDRLLVSDWRSEIGQQYYMKHITQFYYNSLDYELMLRRAFRIKNRVLTAYDNEYARSAYIQTLTNGAVTSDIRSDIVTDPFLQDIIRQKHTRSKLTDIIESIQENQNAIITHDENDSIVVQGCAGSGKTMILLHRLSFIKFRNRDLDLSKIKILTPNRLFNLYINDLSKTLELEKVDRLTINEYYAGLLTRYYNVERTQLGQKCTPNELLDHKASLLYKENAESGWPVLYTNSMREFIGKEAVSYFGYIIDNKIKYGEISALLRDRLKKTLVANAPDMRDIAILQTILKDVKETFLPYYKQLDICRQSQKALQSIERQFLNMKAGLPNADALLDEIIKAKFQKTQNLREQYEQKKRALLRQKDRDAAAEQSIRECDFCLCALLYDKAKHVYDVDKKFLRQEKERIPFSEQDMELIETAYRHAGDFSVATIENMLLETIEHEYGVSLSYKNKLYLKLLIYYALLGKLSGGERLLCVDEGHDLYANEYRLFYLVNGSGLHFNIYGDLRQILIDGEGVGDWDNLYSIFDFSLFALNENYRNSSEIIEYCNRSLGFDTANLGISCEPVRMLNFDGFLEHINNNMIGTRRFAVIVKKKKPSLLKVLREKIADKLNPDALRNGEIALLTPAEAKGLEFDTCYVLTDGMNRNEKYVSFTRALNELYIVTK